jgi:phosphoglycerate dehydrogenase-like enzyme
MEPLPDGVELVSEPAPDVEVVLLAPELWHDLSELFKQMPRLRLIQSFSAGVDSILPVVPPGVVLCNAYGVHDISVSEWVVAAILAMQRRLPEFLDLQHRAEWKRDLADDVSDLEGKSVVVVGYGSIGRAVAGRLAPFGARVVGVSRRRRDDAEAIDALPSLLPDADIVVNLLPLTPQTEKFVDGRFLTQMKAGSLLVNAGRGRTVDTEALLEALTGGRIRAALDVTDPEPLPADHPLWRAPNVLITPHIAGTVKKWEQRAYRFAGEQIRRFASGQPLLGVQTGNTPAARELAN